MPVEMRPQYTASGKVTRLYPLGLGTSPSNVTHALQGSPVGYRHFFISPTRVCAQADRQSQDEEQSHWLHRAPSFFSKTS